MYNTSVPSLEKGWKAGVCEWIIIECNMMQLYSFSLGGGWMCSRSSLLISSGHLPPWLPFFCCILSFLPSVHPSMNSLPLWESLLLQVWPEYSASKMGLITSHQAHLVKTTLLIFYMSYYAHFFFSVFLVLLTLLVSTYRPPRLCMFCFCFFYDRKKERNVFFCFFF